MRILVTGCGRSGTQYTHRLLSLLGLRSSHEKVYNHDLDVFSPPLERINERWNMLDAECSWLAVPFCRTLPEDVVIWHQIRDPLKVIRCWTHAKILSSHNAATWFVHQVFPECAMGSDLQRSVQYVLRWTRMLADYGRLRKNYYRFQIETATPDHLQALLAIAGYTISSERILKAILEMPENVGACGHQDNDPPPTWNDVRREEGGEELYSMWKGWGYVSAA